MLVRDRIYEALLKAGEDSSLEVHRGKLREKPPMSFRHGDVMTYLGVRLALQLDRSEYRVHVNHDRVRRTEETYYIPDLIVIPMAIVGPDLLRPDALAIYDQPLPLVAEVWSPSTGDYDVDEKLPEYKRRGDLEIWRLHPYERTLTAWRRQEDGTYTESVYRGGKVEAVSLPGVTVDLDELFS
jgi:Uma2 family endonuclease